MTHNRILVRPDYNDVNELITLRAENELLRRQGEYLLDVQWRIGGLLSDMIGNVLLINGFAHGFHGEQLRKALKEMNPIFSASAARAKDFSVQVGMAELEQQIKALANDVQRGIEHCLRGDDGAVLRDLLIGFSRENWFEKIRPKPAGAPEGVREHTLLIGKAAAAEKQRNPKSTWVQVGEALIRMWREVPDHEQNDTMIRAMDELLKFTSPVSHPNDPNDFRVSRVDGMRKAVTNALKAYQKEKTQR